MNENEIESKLSIQAIPPTYKVCYKTMMEPLFSSQHIL